MPVQLPTEPKRAAQADIFDTSQFTAADGGKNTTPAETSTAAANAKSGGEKA
jgi:hypothetical protein